MVRRRDQNPLPLAAEWLTEKSDIETSPEDILELAKDGRIELLLMVPGWEARGVGEVRWQQFEPVVIEGVSGRTVNAITPIGNFISYDGRIRVTPEMAARLLDHGACSLESARLPILECLAGQEPLPTNTLLHGYHDGRMISVTHVRVSRNELDRYLASICEAGAELQVRQEGVAPSGVSRKKIMAANWIFQPKYSFDQLSRDMANANHVKWIAAARVSKGARGKDDSVWCPCQLAMQFHERGHSDLKSLSMVMRKSFPEYLDQWHSYEDACK